MDNQVMWSGMDGKSSDEKQNSKLHQRPPSIDNSGDGENFSRPASRSILKRSQASTAQEERQSRSDSLGIQIRPGSKKHKIQFKETLCEIKEVESWKQYNVDEDNYGTKNCCRMF